ARRDYAVASISAPVCEPYEACDGSGFGRPPIGEDENVDGVAPGSATVSNATFVENTGDPAVTAGSGTTIGMVSSTVVGNDAGVGGDVSMLDTLLGFNDGDDCIGGETSLGHNVADDASCNLDQPSDQSGVGDIGVGSPDDNGVVPLLNGSPALDAGTKTGAGGLTVPAKDAEGVARPQGGGVDVGAS